MELVVNGHNVFLIILTILIGFVHLKYLEERKDYEIKKESNWYY